jgi:actin-related protein
MMKFDIMHFINSIFYSTLQLQKMKKERYYNVILCVDMFIESFKPIYKLIVEAIFEYPIINAIRLIPKTVLHIFASGYSSGVIIDIGYLFTHITPVNNGYPYSDKAVTLSLSVSDQERRLKNYILEDNKDGKNRIRHFYKFTDLLNTHLDDLYTRSVICVTKSVSNSIFSNKIEENNLKADYCKMDSYTDIQDFQVK